MRLRFGPMTRQALIDLLPISTRWIPYAGMLPGILYSWDTDDNYELARLGDSIFVRGPAMMNRSHTGVVYASPVVDQRSLDVVRNVLMSGELQVIDEIGIASDHLLRLANGLPHLEIRHDADHSEYLYDTSDLSTIKGASQAKMRNRVNKFTRLYEGRHELLALADLSQDQRDEVYRLYGSWIGFETGGSSHQPEIELEALRRSLHDPCFSDFGDYVYHLCYLDGRLAGFASFLIVNGLAAGFFLKADLRIPCISEWMIHNVAIYLDTRGVRTLNTMEDAGIAGLRTFKQELRPADVAKVFSVRVT